MSSQESIAWDDAFANTARTFRWVGVASLIVYFFSAATIVRPGEVALVLRFGKLLGATRESQVRRPGLLFALPYPIDRVVRVHIKAEYEVLIDELWKPLADAVSATDSIDPLHEGYCLTGDQNILQTRLVAKYHIEDPVLFALRVQDPQGLVRDAVMAATTKTVAAWHVDEALRMRDESTRKNLSASVLEASQIRLNELQCGLILSALQIKEIHPPRHLRVDFERAQSARVDKDTRKRQAEGFALSKAPLAAAESNRLVQTALANASSRRAAATAEVAVFRTLLAEYQRNPGATRDRVYREAMQQIMGQVERRLFLPTGEHTDVRIFISDAEKAP